MASGKKREENIFMQRLFCHRQQSKERCQVFAADDGQTRSIWLLQSGFRLRALKRNEGIFSFFTAP
jgi:hypothetical protein